MWLPALLTHSDAAPDQRLSRVTASASRAKPSQPTTTTHRKFTVESAANSFHGDVYRKLHAIENKSGDNEYRVK